MTYQKLKGDQILHVKRLRSAARWLVFEADLLEKNDFDDVSDLARLKSIAMKVEDRAAEMGELMEDIHVLAGDFEKYIQQEEITKNLGVDL